MTIPQTAIQFYTSKRLSLMGILMTPEGLVAPAPGAVVCHPHPMLGGNMEHPLVTAICGAARQQGIATLRFNFRGVGDSEGTFTNGQEEQDDLRVAFDILKLLPDVDRKRLSLVGCSFGASVVLGGLGRCKSARSMALVAPPLRSVATPKAIRDKRPKLFVVGQRDRVVPPRALQRALDDFRGRVEFTEIPEFDHSLAGQEQVVADRVTLFLSSTL